MRYIGKHQNIRLRQAQINALVNLLSCQDSKHDLKILLESIISPSELAYISQRLHIMKLILDKNNYSEIKDKTGTTNGTINTAKLLTKNIGRKHLIQISNCKIKYKPKVSLDTSSRNEFVNPHIPGAIKFD